VDKQQAYEANQAQESLGLSDSAPSPDLYNGPGFFEEVQPEPSLYSLQTGPPPAAASYNPQYSDPTGASMESLQRTMAVAQASHPEFQNSFFVTDELMNFRSSMVHESTEDRAQFPAPEARVTSYATNNFPANFTNNIYNSPQSTSDLGYSPDDMSTQTPMPFDHAGSFSESTETQSLMSMPSELLRQQFDGLPSLTHDSSESQSPQESNESQNGLEYNTLDIFQSAEDDNITLAPPAPSVPFKSPAPMDIASRRKVQKPTNLLSGNLRNRPSMGPRTVSHADGFRRGVESPLASPMRRIASAGGNRPGTSGNVISGRITKYGAESAQRSPIAFGGFMDVANFERMQNFRKPSIRNAPSLTALSSVGSSLAPPTPMSPSGWEIGFKRETTLGASPHEASMNSYVFNGSANGCFTALEGDHNLTSPPETPHHQLLTPGSGLPNVTDYQDRQWAYEVPDEPLYTPANENFHPELHMPQPLYMTNISQPVSPQFSLSQRFNPANMFPQEAGSPQFKHESPQYTLSTQGNTEYSFPDNQGQYPQLLTSAAMAKQKTFQFSHTTQADFPKK
jgi:hypothetical protein